MPDTARRITWKGDIAFEGHIEGSINKIPVCTIRRTKSWDDSDKPIALDYTRGLYVETAYFDTIRHAKDHADELLEDYLEQIDATFLPPEDRQIAILLRKAADRETWSAEEFAAFWEKLQQRAREKGITLP